MLPPTTAPPSGDDAVRVEAAIVDRIAELERVKSAACAEQARLAIELDRMVRAREADAGVPAGRRGRGVASQLALARRESPHRGQVLLGLARDLVTDLPHTLTALAQGRLNEFRAMVVARETGCLEAADRRRIDEQVCGDPQLLEGLGTARLVGELRRRAYAADPASVTRRAARAEHERGVSLRPAPDTMTYLSGLLPMRQGIAAFTALGRDADTLRAAGDERSRAQIMADLLVERLTGQTTASAVPVTIDLVISDATLFGAGAEPADVPAWGPVPAQAARAWVAEDLDAEIPLWLRRIYVDPQGCVVATSTKQRFAPTGLADQLRIRDQGLCRTSWCDAPARHIDHIVPAADGGPTTAENGQGLCEACNHAKQAPGWRQRVDHDTDHNTDHPAGRHTVQTTTPTGHTHTSTAPSPPTPAAPAPPHAA